jgi:NhaD family Na+/H+ antiporter
MRLLITIMGLFTPTLCFASGGSDLPILNATSDTLAIITLFIFCIAYVFVMLEEVVHLRKSKPVTLAAGIIWVLVAILAQKHNMPDAAHQAIKHDIMEYGELFLFLLSAMTYVNAMTERKVFDALRSYLVRKKFSLKKLFWVTGILALFISPIADNLTTALLMCAVVLAVGQGNKKFVSLSCINIVIAANAGGAFSPFGDITTLMVWQAGLLPFGAFFKIFVPAVVSYIIPAAIMSFAIPNEIPKGDDEQIKMLIGAKRIIFLFLLTIITAVCFHNFLNIPPAIGMMTGLGYLKMFGYYIKMKQKRDPSNPHFTGTSGSKRYDILREVQNAEWDTLLFFYGVILCVGGLATIGYLEAVSSLLYHDLGNFLSAEAHRQTPANVIIGLLSAIVDNIPVMFAVITMNPAMSEGQWLLVTLTAGIGGSMLSIGSAAGVALMGQSKGMYTFIGHLKWCWAIALGYAAGVLCHIWINASCF